MMWKLKFSINKVPAGALVISLLIIHAIATNLERERRAFPGERAKMCTYDHQELIDLSKQLEMYSQPTDATRLVAIQANAVKYKDQKSSENQCKATHAKILAIVSEIMAQKNEHSGQLSTLEGSNLHLQNLVDQINRNSGQQLQIALDKQQQVLQELTQTNRELQTRIQQLQKENVAQALELVRFEIVSNKIEDAKDRLFTMQNHVDLVSGVIVAAYSGNLAHLTNVVKFTYTLRNNLPAFAKASNAAYIEMVSNNHLSEYQILHLFYGIKKAMESSKFASMDAQVKVALYDLKEKIEPHKQNILRSLEKKVRSYSELLKINRVQDLLGRDFEIYFASDMVKAFFYQGDVASNFPALFSFVDRLPYHEAECGAVKAAYDEFQTRSLENTIEALQVWLHARFKLLQEELDRRNDPVLSECKVVLDNVSPYQIQNFVDLYIAKMSTDRAKVLKWHETYEVGMMYFTADVIRSLPSSKFALPEFENLLTLFRYFPHVSHTCFAAAELTEALKKYNLQYKFQGLQVAELVSGAMRKDSYRNIQVTFTEKCESVKNGAPKVFRRLLWGSTNNCKLINRAYDEPLFCPSSHYRHNDITRIIFTYIPKNAERDSDWIIVMQGAFVEFKNEYHNGWNLFYDKKYNRTLDGRERNSLRNSEVLYKLWRIEAVDQNSDFIKFSTYTGSFHVYAASDYFYDSYRRYVMLGSDSNNWNRMWRLSCK